MIINSCSAIYLRLQLMLLLVRHVYITTENMRTLLLHEITCQVVGKRPTTLYLDKFTIYQYIYIIHDATTIYRWAFYTVCNKYNSKFQLPSNKTYHGKI